jgi:hypothetical protein
MEKFELNAVIELFGHTRIAGKVTEQTVAGTSFVRIDVPETEKQPAFTRILHPNAIYAFNPVTEEVMLAMARQISIVPIQDWDIRKMQEKLLALGKANDNPDFEDENI